MPAGSSTQCGSRSASQGTIPSAGDSFERCTVRRTPKHRKRMYTWSITTNCLLIVCDPSPFFLRATGGDGFAGDTNPTPCYPPHYFATNVSVSSVVRTITIGLSFMEPRYCRRVFRQPAAILDISAFFLGVRAGRGRVNGDLFKPVAWPSSLNLNFNIRLKDLSIRFSHHKTKNFKPIFLRTTLPNNG
jgi:hypothetical protein